MFNQRNLISLMVLLTTLMDLSGKGIINKERLNKHTLFMLITKLIAGMSF